MELRQLKYFVEVADNLHFGKAAEQLFVSQPALSQQIQLLEENLGVELLDSTARRKFRKVKLTTAGEFFLEEARKLLTQANALKENTKRIGSERKKLRLGVYKAVLKERIVEFMGGLSRSAPAKEISITEFDNYQDVQEAVLSREIDQGLTLLPIINPVLNYNVLKTGKLSVIMSKNHFLADDQLNIEKLLKEDKWIELSRKVHPVYKEIEERCSLLGINRNIIQEVSSLNLLISLVGLDNGIGFAPSLFDFRSEPNIVVKSLDNTIFENIEICHIAVWL